MQKIILASESPRRRELLSSIGMNYMTYSPNIEEYFDLTLSIEDRVMKIACDKANAVAIPYPNDIVLAADTIVVLDDKIFQKPKDQEEARMMLQALSNREHRVLTGVCIINNGEAEMFYEETKVTFYELDNELIDWYIASKEPNDKAGAYGIQGKGSILVKKIVGDYYNVVGLPLSSTYRKLQKHIEKD